MMHSAAVQTVPPDQSERERALDTSRSILVQAPAGSGKTDLLTRRFLRLLAEVDEPGQIVAITFTKAAAAEMRHRILSKLEEAAAADESGTRPDHLDEFSMETLAARALARSRAIGWNLLDLPAQLRIDTIDAFCRELALQQPLVSGLGGGLDIAEQPTELYRRAARRALEEIGKNDAALSAAIEALLLWRDNGWQEMEDLLVGMLAQRDRWMHGFVLGHAPDWDMLRARLERSFQNAVSEALNSLCQILDQVPDACLEALALARFACAQSDGRLHQELAELAEFPSAHFQDADALEDARQVYVCLAGLLLTNDGGFRKRIDKNLGFPAHCKSEKSRLADLIANLAAVPGIESALASIRTLPPARYTDEDWRIVRACFHLLRHAVAQLRVVFAEAAAVDYTEVSQIALHVLQGEDGQPTDAALAVADGIRHLLVDEFQDTSRRQHQLLGRLIAAWPEREGRTCFVVGDPMQSIYFFRDAEAELFPRAERLGLEIPHDQPLKFDAVRLFANFRTTAPLVMRLNDVFDAIFQSDDGSGVTFSQAEPARNKLESASLAAVADSGPCLQLHLEFAPVSIRGRLAGMDAVRQKERTVEEREIARTKQTQEIVEVIQGHLPRMNQARSHGEKFRIAILGRTRKALGVAAETLREAKIAFRAVELENLKERPEILDALALARALLNPQDRIAWLGVLRAPWCGLSLKDLHALVSTDDPELIKRPIPELLTEREPLLSEEGRALVQRVLHTIASAPVLRFGQPTASLGTWIEQLWLRLGGEACVDATARANLDLLWRCLDNLPEGEPDLLGPALDAALDKLTAQPDPNADSDCGVQLMTIHKAKGLEFEVVIVPELQAITARTRGKLLSWLERGLPPQDKPDETEDSSEVTEFLVAPLPSKGRDRGKAKKWVDRIYHERESQEMRRILYVAATRACNELHLFARPEYKTGKDGSLSLAEPQESLLKTAWPALESEIRERFDAWSAARAIQEPESATLESLAAGADNLVVMPAMAKPARLRRLPAEYRAPQSDAASAGVEPPILGAGRLYERHEGGLLSRTLGTAVHTLLQELAQLRQIQEWEPARTAVIQLEPRIAAQIRATGIERSHAGRIAEQALAIALKATHDPIGQWILSPHTDAASEVRWAGIVAGNLRTVQVDRVFRAGPAPLSSGDDTWWIIDYKTAHADKLDPEIALPELRRLFAPQLETYAQVLRNLHGSGTPIRAGLYYPRMMQFDEWKM